MSKPDWHAFALDPSVRREPSPDKDRLVLWFPDPAEGNRRQWLRVGNVPGAGILADPEQGVSATAAIAIRARPKARGLFGKLFGKSAGGQEWVLPNGQTAEQLGERQTDLLLVWAAPDADPLDEEQIKELWPESKSVRRLGGNLFLLDGVKPAPTAAAPAPALGAGLPTPPPANPQELAERLLAEARQSGDRRAEVSALTDLGIMLRNDNKVPQAVAMLEEALAISRQLGDRQREGDVLGNLALTVLMTGQGQRAADLLEQELALARQAGDRYQEKTALANFGVLFSRVRDHARALSAYDQALRLAREVGDRHHEADLLWFMVVQYAELGQRDQALAVGQVALTLLEQMGNPFVGMLRDELRKYKAGDTAALLTGAAAVGGGVWTMEGAAMGMVPGPEPGGGGPGLLRMAFSASKSLARFVSSGFRVASPATFEARVQTCQACEHHTGVRCRLCGCFTAVKARMPHEVCPINKWPSQAG